MLARFRQRQYALWQAVDLTAGQIMHRALLPTPTPLITSTCRLLAAAFVSFIIYGCSGQASNSRLAPVAEQPTHEVGHPQVTVASWYGPGFHGHPTSSGERYNQQALTAASRTLPLGSHARVTNLRTGKSVVVRINDRGPFVRGRGIDLSRAAAHRIGIDHRGVAKVKVTRVDGHSAEIANASIDASPTKHGSHVASAKYAGTTNPPMMESGIISTPIAR